MHDGKPAPGWRCSCVRALIQPAPRILSKRDTNMEILQAESCATYEWCSWAPSTQATSAPSAVRQQTLVPSFLLVKETNLFSESRAYADRFRFSREAECRDVFLVDPACDHLSQEGFNAAANPISRDLLQRVHVEESLPQAIENCSMAIALTRRTGKIRLPSFTLTELIVPEHENFKLALVFGREDRGLHTYELLQCTHVCTISSGAWQGSLNLSHAVAVVLSRLYESWAPKQKDLYETVRLDSVAYKTLPGTANVSDVENLLHRWELVFMSCNYWAKWAGMPEFTTPERLFLFLRKLLQRARPSIREVTYLHGFLTVIEDLATVVSKIKKGHDSDG